MFKVVATVLSYSNILSSSLTYYPIVWTVKCSAVEIRVLVALAWVTKESDSGSERQFCPVGQFIGICAGN